MFCVLPFACLAGLWLLLMQRGPGEETAPGARRTMLGAGVLFGLLVWAGVELPSLWKGITFESLGLFWGVSTVVTVVVLLCRRDRGWTLRKPSVPNLDALSWAMVGAVAFLTVVTALVALAAPPNTWDSMTYHMSRVAHWTQNRSVDFYATSIPRQNHLSPFAEYAILHLYILWDGDRLANTVQWLAMVGCLSGVSLIAQYLGAGLRGQILAAFCCAAIPMGILQASGTQTDYVAAFWIVSFTALVLPWLKGEAIRRTDWALAGAALGLAILTKGTAYVFLLPLLIWLAVALLRRREWRTAACLVMAGAIALSVNLGHYSRNWRLVGSPLATGQDDAGQIKYNNDAFGPRITASNLLRNIGIHFGSPVSVVNHGCAKAVLLAHRAMGISVDDPRTTWANCAFRAPRFGTHEDTAGSPLSVLIAIIAVLLVFSAGVFRRNAPLLCFTLNLLGAALLFCALLRWQPWHVRLHLPLLVLSCAIAGVVLSTGRRSGLVIFVVASALFAYALAPALSNASRPLAAWPENVLTVPRANQYFANRPGIGGVYARVAEGVAANRCRTVGLVMGGDDWEYPLWAFLKEVQADVRVEHVLVTDRSARLGDGLGPAGPDVILCTTPYASARLELGRATYANVARSSTITVWTRIAPDTGP